VTLNTPTAAFYTGDGETSTFQDRLDAATQAAIDQGLFALVPGVQSVVVNIPDDTDRNSSAQMDNGLTNPWKVFIAVVSLTLVLVAVLFVRRRRSSQDESSVYEEIDGTNNDLDDNTRVLPHGNSGTYTCTTTAPYYSIHIRHP
jgi:hypothetical protein